MDWPSAASYREWDQQTDSAWFRFGHQLPDSIRAQIRPLTAEYASRLWEWAFPTDKDVLPLVAKDKSGWLKRVFDSEPIWFGGSQPSTLVARFRQLLPWPDDDIVFFLVRRGAGYQTFWGLYLQHWERFLGWYDEGLLLHPTAREVLVFWEVSAVFVGRRNKRRLLRGAQRRSSFFARRIGYGDCELHP